MRSAPGKMTPVVNIDAYLARVDPDKRAALERLRRSIKAVVPRGEECISYGLPCFRLDGRMLLHFGAAAKHCAFYPGGIVSQFASELSGFETSKGTIRFSPERPLPASLVRRIVKALVERQDARFPRASAAAKGRRTATASTSAKASRPRRATRSLKPRQT